MAKHGFDLTFVGKEEFEKVLDAVSIDTSKPPCKFRAYGLSWKGNGIEIVTTNNPITGVNAQGPNYRETEVGYAGSIGIEGDKEKVLKAANLIKKLAGDIKGESHGQRGFV